MDQTKDCTRELIAKAHNNDKEAREKLVTDNLGLIWNIIKDLRERNRTGGSVSDRLYRAYKGN